MCGCVDVWMCGCVDVCEPVALLICGHFTSKEELEFIIVGTVHYSKACVLFLGYLLALSLGSFRAISCCVLSTLVFSCFVSSRSLFLSFRSLVT